MPIFRLRWNLTFQVPVHGETKEQAKAKLAEQIVDYLKSDACTKERIAEFMEVLEFT